MVGTVKDLYGQPTNTAQMMQDTADPDVLAQIYQQMQQGMDQTQPQVRANKPGRLVLTKNRNHDLNMSFNKNQVPEMSELNVSYDQSQAPQPERTPIGSRRGRGLYIPFDTRRG
jgi:hypothetical protein